MTTPVWRQPETTGWGRLPMHALEHPDRLPLDGTWRFQLLNHPEATVTAEWGEIPPHWMTYFAIDNCDAGAEKVKALGGQVMHRPFDSPYGRIAVVSDPYGAVFSIIQMPQQAS